MKEKLCIVGSGISGLYLAKLLEEIYEVTIIEARDRVGGRIFSINGNDMGPSWVWRHHQNTIDLIQSLNLELFRQYGDGEALYDTKESVQRFTQPNTANPFRIKGTLSILVNALEKSLKNTKIILNEKVESFNDLETGIELRTDKNRYIFDRTILTLPPRLINNLEFTPPLTKEDSMKLQNTQTWMGNSAKCVIEFSSCFWRKKGLSGFVFSNQGPLSEIHDASTDMEYALFGFVRSQADMKTFEKDLTKQLQRVFGIEKKMIKNIYLLDWRQEKFTATSEDAKPLREHPCYGIELSYLNKKVDFSSTEFSFDEGGYIEGAIMQAKKIAKKLEGEV